MHTNLAQTDVLLRRIAMRNIMT